ncbi:MAG: DUF4259 domain-containing protein [Aggregatilineales bacterium]
MGTWDEGNFDNDGATILLQTVTAQSSLKPVREAFDAILALNGYIDVDYGQEAIAAAEVVALLKGNPAKSIPEYLTEWHQTHKLLVDNLLIEKAILAVKKATEDPKVSELRGLWEGTNGVVAGWYANVTDLMERLGS